MTLAEFWPLCLRRLHNELSEQQFNLAIASTTVGVDNGAWVLYARNQFCANLLRSQYAARLNAMCQEWFNRTPEWLFKVGTGEDYPMASQESLIARTQPQAQETPESEASSAPAQRAKNPRENAASHTLELLPPEEAPIPDTAPPRKHRTAKDILAERMREIRANAEKKNAAATASVAPTPAPAVAMPIATVACPAPIVVEKIPIPSTKNPRPTQRARHNLSPEYTFDTLVEGKGNYLAAAIAKSIAESPGDNIYNPFFVYGSTGLGKTHLVQAIGNELIKLNPEAKVRYVHADEYLKGFMQAVRNKTWDAFKQQYLHYDLLIIDDIQFIQGKDRTMEEFFFLFEHFHSRNQQIVITCDQLPSSLENMEKRLISRFSWGMTIKLEPPELEMRIDILEHKARAAGMAIEEDASLFIAQHIRENVRELEGALNRILARCRFQKRRSITLDMAKESLDDLVQANNKTMTVQSLMQTVADYYNLRVSDLLGKKRLRSIARPRQLAMALVKELMGLSLPTIGEAFGGRNHTTVMHALKTIKKLRGEDEELNQDYDKLKVLAQI